MITIATLDFLRALKENNNKVWFDQHKSDYTQANDNVLRLVQALLESLIPMEPKFASVNAKDCLFRIYRDVRFAKDKSPYKTNLGISLSTGKKEKPLAGYYIHLEPCDQSFLVGGIYEPNAFDLKKIRNEIDYQYPQWKAILDQPEFVNYFGGLRADKSALTRLPTGFAQDSPAAAYLKMKSYLASRSLLDVDLVSQSLVTLLLEGMVLLQPLLQFLNQPLNE